MRRILNWAALALPIALAAGTARAEPSAYVPLGSANQVVAIDVAAGRITQTFTGVANPHGLVATPDKEYLVAGSLSENPLPQGTSLETPNSKLYLIHPLHGHVMTEIPVPGWTHHLAITPDGRHVLSTHPTRGWVTLVDLQQGKVVQTIRTGNAPNYALVSRDGKTAYVSNTANGSISELDLASATVVRKLEGGSTPEHLVSSPEGSYLFAANAGSGRVSKVSVATGKVERDYAVGRQVHGLDISDDGTTLFATSRSDGRLAAIDVATGSQKTLSLSPDPYHLNTIPGTGKVYVSSATSPVIWVVEQATLTVSKVIDLPAGEGHQIAVVR